MSNSDDFDYPWQYTFPPFFTLQPNADTRRKQLECWSNLVLDYCQVKKIYSLDVTDALFFNGKINRKLSSDGLEALLAYMEKTKHIEWTDKNNKTFRVHWKTTEEWANVIYNWAVSNGFLNSVCTLYELMHGEDNRKESFHKIDQAVLMQALRTLQSQGKAEIMTIGGNEGVKFF